MPSGPSHLARAWVPEYRRLQFDANETVSAALERLSIDVALEGEERRGLEASLKTAQGERRQLHDELERIRDTSTANQAEAEATLTTLQREVERLTRLEQEFARERQQAATSLEQARQGAADTRADLEAAKRSADDATATAARLAVERDVAQAAAVAQAGQLASARAASAEAQSEAQRAKAAAMRWAQDFVEAAADEHERSIADLRRKVDDSQRALAQARDDSQRSLAQAHSDLDDTLEEWRIERSRLEMSASSIRSELILCERREATLKGRVERLKYKVENLEGSLLERTDGRNDALEQARTAIAAKCAAEARLREAESHVRSAFAPTGAAVSPGMSLEALVARVATEIAAERDARLDLEQNLLDTQRAVDAGHSLVEAMRERVALSVAEGERKDDEIRDHCKLIGEQEQRLREASQRMAEVVAAQALSEADAEQVIESLRADLAHADCASTRLSEELAAAQDEHEAAVRELIGERDSIVARLDASHLRTEVLEDQVSGVTQQLASARAAQSKAEAERDKRIQELGDVRRRDDQALVTLRTELEKLKREKSSAASRVGVLEASAATMRDRVTALEGQLNDARTKARDSQATAATAQRHRGEALEQMRCDQKAREVAEARASRAESAAAEAKEHLVQMERDLRNARQQVVADKELQARLVLAESARENATTELRHAQNELVAAQTRLSMQDETIKSLQATKATTGSEAPRRDTPAADGMARDPAKGATDPSGSNAGTASGTFDMFANDLSRIARALARSTTLPANDIVDAVAMSREVVQSAALQLDLGVIPSVDLRDAVRRASAAANLVMLTVGRRVPGDAAWAGVEDLATLWLALFDLTAADRTTATGRSLALNGEATTQKLLASMAPVKRCRCVFPSRRVTPRNSPLT